MPTALIQGSTSLMGVAVNQILIGFSATAVALYGVLTRVLNMINIIPNGIALGVIPIVAYNYGAQSRTRVRETIKTSLLFALAGSLAGTAVLMSIPRTVIGLFNPGEGMLAMAVPAIRIMGLMLPLSSISLVLAAVFQGFSRARDSLYLSLSRQLVLLLPALFLLSLSGALNAVWAAFPITEALSLLVAVFLYKRVDRSIISRVGEAEVLPARSASG